MLLLLLVLERKSNESSPGKRKRPPISSNVAQKTSQGKQREILSRISEGKKGQKEIRKKLELFRFA